MAIVETWDKIRTKVGPPRTIAALVAKGGSLPTWWLPTLAYLAYLETESERTRAVLDAFAARRNELSFAVVEEKTDAVLGLTIQPWPLLDSRGRLRFPIHRDPLQVEVDEERLTRLRNAADERLKELGLRPAELPDREIQIGATFALAVNHERDPSWVRARPQDGDSRPRYLGGLLANGQGGPKSVSVPLLDITWDAREAGKLAHYAAAAGVIAADGPEESMVASVQETETRYMVGFRDKKDPRDVSPRDLT